jgi:hypothetical protein
MQQQEQTDLEPKVISLRRLGLGSGAPVSEGRHLAGRAPQNVLSAWTAAEDVRNNLIRSRWY